MNDQAGHGEPHPWTEWIMKATLSAGAVFGLGMLTMGAPGIIFLNFAQGTGLTRELSPDSVWPLAIDVTLMGALLIIPASVAVRLAMPGLTGRLHAVATAMLTSLATVLVTPLIVRWMG